MKFNHIVINPPYNKNLHLKILREAMKHIEKDGGEIVCLHPKNYYETLNVYYNPKNVKYTRYCFTRLVSYEDIDRRLAQEMFGTGFNTLNLIVGVYSSEVVREETLKERDYNLKKKMRKYYKEPSCGFDNIRTKRDKLGNKPYILFNQYNVNKLEDYFADEKSDVSYGLEFNTEEELNNWKEWIMSSKIVKWLINKKFWGLILPKVDFNTKWTDADLYEYFDLNEEEIKEIENAI